VQGVSKTPVTGDEWKVTRQRVVNSQECSSKWFGFIFFFPVPMYVPLKTFSFLFLFHERGSALYFNSVKEVLFLHVIPACAGNRLYGPGKEFCPFPSYQLALVITLLFRERGSALSRHILIKSGTRPNTTLYFILIPVRKFCSLFIIP
jgi:hypothetical protein